MNKYNLDKAVVYDLANAIDLLKTRKLKEIISSEFSKEHIGKEIYICDKDKIHGIIILNNPTQLNKDQLNNHFSRHFINEDLRSDILGKSSKLNAYTFRIKKIFKEPKTYNTNDKLATFINIIEDIKILSKDTEIINKFKLILEDIRNKNSVEGKEYLKELFENLYELFLCKYSAKIASKQSEKNNV